MPRKSSKVEAGIEGLLTKLIDEATNAPSSDGVTSGEAITFGDRLKLIEIASKWVAMAHKIAPDGDDDNVGFGKFLKQHRGAAGRGAGGKAASDGADG
jgi:hypothetical protein